MPDPVTLSGLLLGAAVGVGGTLGALAQKIFEARARRAEKAAELRAARKAAAAAAEADAEAADATGRHAVHAEEVRVTPALLQRIDTLEQRMDKERDECAARIRALEQERDELVRRIQTLEAENGAARETIEDLESRLNDVRAALDVLSRKSN